MEVNKEKEVHFNSVQTDSIFREVEEVKEDQDLPLEEEVTLPKGLKRYTSNNFDVEWDLYVKGASELWLKKMKAYRNVFNTVENLYEMLIELGYKVAYGYFKVTDKKYMRSCFLVRDGEVIDTNRQFFKEKMDMEYITFVEMDVQDYIRVVSQEDGDIGLLNYLKRYESNWKRYAKEQGVKSLV